jgi:hypothetical protein
MRLFFALFALCGLTLAGCSRVSGGSAPAPAYVPSGGVSVHSRTFAVTGFSQVFLVPDDVTKVTVSVAGSQGGDAGGPVPGKGRPGGSVKATLPVTPGESWEIIVGDQPPPQGVNHGGAGGRASEIRAGNVRLIVAGGGGGGGSSCALSHLARCSGVGGMGGLGGALDGGNGAEGGIGDPISGGGAGGGGGTQSSGGVGGLGADGRGKHGKPGVGPRGGSSATGTDLGEGGGGGDGYFGGGQGGDGYSGTGGGGGGGGGSSFAAARATDVTFVRGGSTGDGQVIITW